MFFIVYFLRTRSLFRAAAGYVAFSCARIFRCLWQAHFPVRHFLCPHLRRTSDHCLSRLIAIVSCHKSGFYFDVYLSKQRNIIIFILCKKIAFHRNFIKFLDFRSIRHLVVIIVHQIFIQILGSVQRPLNLLTIHLIAYHLQQPARRVVQPAWPQRCLAGATQKDLVAACLRGRRCSRIGGIPQPYQRLGFPILLRVWQACRDKTAAQKILSHTRTASHILKINI